MGDRLGVSRGTERDLHRVLVGHLRHPIYEFVLKLGQ
jgi:hypothetical protein